MDWAAEAAKFGGTVAGSGAGKDWAAEAAKFGGTIAPSSAVSPEPPFDAPPDRLKQMGSNPLVRGAYGLAEGATNLLTGMGASAVGGIEGLNKLISAPWGDKVNQATGAIQKVQDKYTYQPRTAEGATAAHVVGLPLELAGKAGAYAGKNSEIARMLGVTDAAESIGEITPAVIATLFMGKGAKNKAANRPNVTDTANDPFLRAKALREAGNDSMRLDSIAKAKEAGLTINPIAVQKNLTNKTASTLIGDTSLDKAAATKNKPVMTAMVKEDIGVPGGTPLSPEVLNARITEAAKPYEELRGVKSFSPDGKFQSEVATMNDFSGHSPAVQDFLKQNAPKLQAEVQAMAEGGFNGNDVVTLMQKFRKDANSVLSNKAQQSPEALALANAQRTAAKAIEGLVDRNLAAAEKANPGQGFGDLAQRFRDGRTTIAKIKTIEPFIDGNGNFVPTRAFRLSKNNASYTGNLKTLSDVSGSFPESFMPAPLSGGALNVSHSGVLNSIRHLLSDPLERYVLSDKYQQKNMSGLDPRDVRTRLGYGEPPPEPVAPAPSPNNGLMLPYYAGEPLRVFPDGSTMTGAQAEAMRLANMVQPSNPKPMEFFRSSPLPIQKQASIGKGPRRGKEGIDLSNPTKVSGPSLMALEEPQASTGRLSDIIETRPFDLKLDVANHPEIVRATHAFIDEAATIRDAIAQETNGFKKAQLEAKLRGTENRFMAGWKELGFRNEGELRDLTQKLYQSGGKTQRGIEKVKSLKDLMKKEK